MTNLIVGLMCLAVGAWGVSAWWDEFGEVLRGAIPIVFIMAGLGAIGAGMRAKGACKPNGGDKEPHEATASFADALSRRD